jgi:hypothetical protein
MRISSTGKMMMRRRRKEKSIRERYNLLHHIIMECLRAVIEFSQILLMGRLAIHSKPGKISIISCLLIMLQVWWEEMFNSNLSIIS